MKLTEFESGIEFELDVNHFGSVFNRGPYREVRTIDSDFYKQSPVIKVREQVPEIIAQAHAEGGEGK